MTRRATEQAHVVLAARSVDRNHPSRYALAVLNHVLGGGLSSRLFQEIRERRGLAYSVWSERVAYADAGFLSVGLGTGPEHVAEVLDIVTDELASLGADGVTERELAIAKGNLRAETLLACEDSGARMSRIGAGQLLHGEVLTVDEVLARVEALTLEDVHARRPGPGRRAPDPVRRRRLRRVRLRRRGAGPGLTPGSVSVGTRRRAPARSPGATGRALARVTGMRVGVVGAGGRMGREVCRTVLRRPGLELVAAVDPGMPGATVAELTGLGGTEAAGLTVSAGLDALGGCRRRGGRGLHPPRGVAGDARLLRRQRGSTSSWGPPGSTSRTSTNSPPCSRRPAAPGPTASWPPTSPSAPSS